MVVELDFMKCNLTAIVFLPKIVICAHNLSIELHNGQ